MRITADAVPGRVAYRGGLIERVSHADHSLVIVVDIAGSLVDVSGCVGMIFIRRPGERAVGIVTSLGKAAVLMRDFGHLAPSVVLKPSGVAARIDHIPEPVHVRAAGIIKVLSRMAGGIGIAWRGRRP